MLGLGLSLTTGGVATPAYVVLAKAFVSRVEADGGTVDSFACLKTDMAYLTSKPDAPAGYTAEWSGATVGSSAEFRINLVGGAGYTYTYAVTDTQATEVTGTGVMGGNIQAVTADLSTLVDGTVTLAVYLTGAGGDGNVVTDTANLVGVDADYQAVLDRGTALGYTLPSPSQQVLQETLIADLKTAGVWDKLDVFYVFATDGDSDYATLNWKSPSSFQTTKVNSPTFTTNQGYQGDGSSSYLDTNFIASAGTNNRTQNDGHISAYVNVLSTNSVGSQYAGSRFPDTRLGANYHYMNDGTIYINNNQYTGLNYMGRDSSTNRILRKGGNVLPITTATSSFIPILSSFILAVNNAGNPLLFSNGQVSTFSEGAELGASVVDFENAINTYMTAL